MCIHASRNDGSIQRSFSRRQTIQHTPRPAHWRTDDDSHSLTPMRDRQCRHHAGRLPKSLTFGDTERRRDGRLVGRIAVPPRGSRRIGSDTASMLLWFEHRRLIVVKNASFGGTESPDANGAASGEAGGE
ncbi:MULTISPECIES: hypothetical protein [Burkholderia]|uniref:hypothetical protein n=1 Tax=Burkholderia TaxID=32008 RepID=UPI0012E3333C|nr:MULTISPECIES: hypothetical protein [Burkholderia]